MVTLIIHIFNTTIDSMVMLFTLTVIYRIIIVVMSTNKYPRERNIKGINYTINMNQTNNQNIVIGNTNQTDNQNIVIGKDEHKKDYYGKKTHK